MKSGTMCTHGVCQDITGATMQRRDFLAAVAASMASALAGCSQNVHRTGSRKSILVLGGTNFVGPAIVERAIAAGYDVTLFNRGITRPYLFPELEKLRGNRSLDGSDLGSLISARRWDAVIDVWPWQSGLVAETARLLADRADYYFFCSSIAVYRDFSRPGIDETAPVHENDPGWYGGEKAIAEQAVRRYFPDSNGISRCHAILGPRDDGHFFHYWLRRMATFDEVLAPGSGQDPVQYVDVRDVAQWIVDCVEMRRVGTYNLSGPMPSIRLRDFLEQSRSAIGSSARLIWADADFLRKTQSVQSFTDMPLWAPLDEDEGFYQIDGSKAIDDRIAYRPLTATARDAWQWHRSHFFRDISFPVGGIGLSRDREEQILSAWHAQG